jgi:hypothetical protein
MKTTNVEIMDTYVKTSILKHGSKVQSTKNKIVGNIYELEVALKDKVYLETYYRHQLGTMVVHEIPSKIKAHEL